MNMENGLTAMKTVERAWVILMTARFLRAESPVTHVTHSSSWSALPRLSCPVATEPAYQLVPAARPMFHVAFAAGNSQVLPASKLDFILYIYIHENGAHPGLKTPQRDLNIYPYFPEQNKLNSKF